MSMYVIRVLPLLVLIRMRMLDGPDTKKAKLIGIVDNSIWYITIIKKIDGAVIIPRVEGFQIFRVV